MAFFSGIRRRFSAVMILMLAFLTVAVTAAVVVVIRQYNFEAAMADLDRDIHAFRTLVRHRTVELHTRAKLLAAEPRVIAALGTPGIDRATVQFLTEEIRADGDLDVMIMWGREGWQAAVAVKNRTADTPPDISFEPPGADGAFASMDGRDVLVVSTPVKIGGDVNGHILIGEDVVTTFFPSLYPLIASDILLFWREDGGGRRRMASSQEDVPEQEAVRLMTDAGKMPGALQTSVGTRGGYFVRQAGIGGQVDGLFLKSLASTEAAVRDALKISVLIAAIFLLAAGVLVNLVSGTVTRPIVRLVESTNRFSTGQFDARTDIHGPEELRRLGESFNSMAERIQTLIAAEESAKAGLEERVRERTAELSEVNRQLLEAHQKLREETARLIQYEKLAGVGTLSAGVAHELNNPLVVIIGNLQILCDAVENNSHQKTKLETVLRHARRCADIVQNLLRFSRREGPKQVKTHIAALVDRAIDLAQIGVGFKDVRVVRNHTPNLPPVFVDENLMEHVFLNITTNGFQAIRDHRGKGTFTVSSEVSGERLILRFQDDGPGMTPEVAAKIFDPFFTTKIVGQGTGLGLSVAHGIVTQHGGSIFVERSDSSGTTIVVSLPLS